VVNSYTCENLDGRWRDLLANVKQKAILSAVWSGLGLQGRKIKELLDGAALGAPPAPPVDDGRGGAKALLAKMGLGGKGRREGGAEAELTEEELKALQKRRALFGDQHVRALAARRGPEPGGGGGGATAAAGSAPLAVAAGRAARSPAGSSQGGSLPGSSYSTPGGSPTKAPGAGPRSPGRSPVPPLDLQRPLPPEGADAGDPPGGSARSGGLGGGLDSARSRGSAEMPQLSGPLRAGLAAVGLAGGGGGGASGSGSGSARGEPAPAAALLGQAYQQQQAQQDTSAAQLLGHAPRRGGSSWVHSLASRVGGRHKQ
jgi:hypothetical protein